MRKLIASVVIGLSFAFAAAFYLDNLQHSGFSHKAEMLVSPEAITQINVVAIHIGSIAPSNNNVDLDAMDCFLLKLISSSSKTINMEFIKNLKKFVSDDLDANGEINKNDPAYKKLYLLQANGKQKSVTTIKQAGVERIVLDRNIVLKMIANQKEKPGDLVANVFMSDGRHYPAYVVSIDKNKDFE